MKRTLRIIAVITLTIASIIAVVTLAVAGIIRLWWSSIKHVSAQSKAAPQAASISSYAYDEKGRLRAVISPTGDSAVYDYDKAGNIAGLRRLGPDALELLGFTPHRGRPGARVTFSGLGFAQGVSQVSFNGADSQTIQVNAPRIVATVPSQATTGLVTIATANGTVVTSMPFTVLPPLGS